jgi:hypothetical protein
MKVLTDHKLNGLNEALAVKVLDEAGPGGACHVYEIHADESVCVLRPGVTVHTLIQFQKGPIQEAGINGISQEALLAVVIDRLRDFQAGPYACRENALALTNLEQAIMWLQKRTRDRLARGVEGTSVK